MIHARIIMGVAVAGVFAASGCATELATAVVESQPKVLAGNIVRITATVAAVDRENRILTLSDGREEIRMMTVDPAVKNFDQIRRGDRINAERLEQVAIYVQAPGTVSKDENARVAVTVRRGGKPSGAMVDTVQRGATVEEIDYEGRVVTLRATDGELRTIRVAPEIGPLDKISKGDQIVVRYTQIVGIGVTEPAH